MVYSEENKKDSIRTQNRNKVEDIIGFSKNTTILSNKESFTPISTYINNDALKDVYKRIDIKNSFFDVLEQYASNQKGTAPIQSGIQLINQVIAFDKINYSHTDIKGSQNLEHFNRAKKFFDESLNFIKEYVGSENIRYAAIHLDESTPHMHIYFTPVVNEVKRKVFELDENGHQLKHEIINKNGEKKLVPIQKKDENGKNIYETVKGKFLNSDQFWKQKGGNASYTLLQDDYNEFIKSKGFNLFRGEIGGDKTHLTNAMKQQIELNALNREIKQENELLKEANKAENKFIDKVDTEISNDILNPVKKGIMKQYKDEDIDKLSLYSKELAEDNIKKD